MTRTANFWMYRPYANMGTIHTRKPDVCTEIVVGHVDESRTGKRRYIAGCSVCGAKASDYEREVVELFVEEHNKKVRK